MTTSEACHDVLDSEVGPVVPVAARSRFKPLATALPYGGVGLILLGGAISMLTFELPRLWQEDVEPEWVIVGFAAAFLPLSFLLIATLLRRIRAVCDDRLYFRAGPGGVSVCFPTKIDFRAWLLAYRIEPYDLSLDQITKWYPFIVRYNGIPVSSQIVFEGEQWKLAVSTLYFTGTWKSITASISAAFESAAQTPAEDPLAATE